VTNRLTSAKRGSAASSRMAVAKARNFIVEGVPQ
jgi:hypothetical protein